MGISLKLKPIGGSKMDTPSSNTQTDAFITKPSTTTRHGRAGKAKKTKSDMVNRAEYESVTDVGNTNGHNDERQAPTPTELSMPEKSDSERTSNESRAPLVQPPNDTPHDSNTYKTLDMLRSAEGIQIDLPELQTEADPDIEEPWSAQMLSHLYLASYHEKQWNICDLVIDTWIRAFQKLNKYEETSIWRPNNSKFPVIDHDAPYYDGLDVQDPQIAHDFASFEPDTVNEIYNHTSKTCGARLLFADAMALCGSRLEDRMEKMTEEKERENENENENGMQWHPDLLFNIMCTSLRMVRRKLTLKLEEDNEGAWCRRYHEHAKHDLPCYRQAAWEEKENQKPKVQVQEKEVQVPLQVEKPKVRKREWYQEGKPIKRRRRENKREKESSRGKRVKFSQDC